MRKLIAEEWISMDGFAEDKKGALDYFPSSAENRYADERQLKVFRYDRHHPFGTKDL